MLTRQNQFIHIFKSISAEEDGVAHRRGPGGAPSSQLGLSVHEKVAANRSGLFARTTVGPRPAPAGSRPVKFLYRSIIIWLPMQ